SRRHRRFSERHLACRTAIGSPIKFAVSAAPGPVIAVPRQVFGAPGLSWQCRTEACHHALVMAVPDLSVPAAPPSPLRRARLTDVIGQNVLAFPPGANRPL